jgi:hypothetical protein
LEKFSRAFFLLVYTTVDIGGILAEDGSLWVDVIIIILGKKEILAFFSITNVMLHFLNKLTVF